MNKIIFALSASLLLFSVQVSADVTVEKTSATESQKSEPKWGIGGHPIFGYDNESSLTLGAGCVFYVEPDDKNQNLDEYELHSSYNFTKQYDFMLSYSKFFKNNFCNIDGEFGFQKYPQDFEDENYDAVFIPFDIGTSFKIKDNIYAGPIYRFKYSNIDFIEDDSNITQRYIGDSGEKYYSGFGLQFVINNVPKGQLYKREGNNFKITTVNYSEILGSDFSFTTIKADYRQYFPFFQKCVLAYQIVAKLTFGDVPFIELPSVKSNKILRGGTDNYGNFVFVCQTEFRFPIFWRIGGTVFAGIGESNNVWSEFGQNTCIAGGTGLRLTLNKKKNITMRFDFAINNKADTNVYIKILEAF